MSSSLIQDSCTSTITGDASSPLSNCSNSSLGSSCSGSNNHLDSCVVGMDVGIIESVSSIVTDVKPSPVVLQRSISAPSSTTPTQPTTPTNASSPSASSVDHSPKRLCLVCGDVASGFHYGVASCEACKAFFKRTIQGNIEYQCPASNDCEINKRRRKACQACRFQKCLRMGMLKEGVRLDRVRGGRQKYRRTLDGTQHHSNTAVPSASNASSSHHHHYSSTVGGSISVSTPLNVSSGTSGSKRSSIEDNKIVIALLNCEPDPLVFSSRCLSTASSIGGSSSTNSSASSSPSSPSSVRDVSPLSTAISISPSGGSPFCLPLSSGGKGVQYLSDLVDRELVSTISWAKQIPGFTDLILNDQMRLLQTTWGEILSLSLAYRSQLHSNANGMSPCGFMAPYKLIFASDFVMDEMQAITCKAEEMFAMILQLTRRLAGLRLAREEYLVLKALLLTNVDIPLEDSSSVFKLRESLLVTLQDCVSSLRSPIPASTHLGQILLCLPLIRQTDAAIRRYWINVRKEGKIHMNKLFIEMLESGSSITR